MLRQVYNAFILALWYKRNLKAGILNDVYINKKKTAGVDVDDKAVKEKIYKQYLQAYKKGVYNLIKEDIDPSSQAVIPRKYFSGGVDLTQTNWAMITPTDAIPSDVAGHILSDATVHLQSEGPGSAAMTTTEYENGLRIVARQIVEGNVKDAASKWGAIVSEFYGHQLEMDALIDEQSVLTSLAKLITYEDQQTAQIIEKVTKGRATPEDIIRQNLLVATKIALQALKARQEMEVMIAEKQGHAGPGTSLDIAVNRELSASVTSQTEALLGDLNRKKKEQEAEEGRIRQEISKKEQEIQKLRTVEGISKVAILVKQFRNK